MRGDIRKTLLSECDAGKADLLLLGASELEDWKDHRFRLFSQAIAGEASCPVLVVKYGKEAGKTKERARGPI